MYPSLMAEMARKGIMSKDLANTLELSWKTVRNKINGKSSFSDKEMLKIKNTYFPNLTIDYLFFDNQ